jgi:hypothetical protein
MKISETETFVTIELGSKAATNKKIILLTKRRLEILLVILPAMILWGILSFAVLCYIIIDQPTVLTEQPTKPKTQPMEIKKIQSVRHKTVSREAVVQTIQSATQPASQRSNI